MNRTLIGTFVAVLAGASMVAAQSQSSPQSDQPGSPSGSSRQAPSSSSSVSPSSASQTTVTYTGCLEEGSTPGTYVLKNVSATGAAGQARSSASESSSGAKSAGAATEGQQFALSGTVAGFDMRTNLNHRVEVTATPSASGASGSAGVSSDPHAGMEAGQSNPQSNAGQNSSNAGQSGAGQSSMSSPSSQANASAGMSAQANLQTITVKTARSLSDRCSVE